MNQPSLDPFLGRLVHCVTRCTSRLTSCGTDFLARDAGRRIASELVGVPSIARLITEPDHRQPPRWCPQFAAGADRAWAGRWRRPWAPGGRGGRTVAGARYSALAAPDFRPTNGLKRSYSQTDAIQEMPANKVLFESEKP
jgi:hypothetical protein